MDKFGYGYMVMYRTPRGEYYTVGNAVYEDKKQAEELAGRYALEKCQPMFLIRLQPIEVRAPTISIEKIED